MNFDPPPLVYCPIQQQQQHNVYTPKTAKPSSVPLENIMRFICPLEVWCILMHWCILDLVYTFNGDLPHWHIQINISTEPPQNWGPLVSLANGGFFTFVERFLWYSEQISRKRSCCPTVIDIKVYMNTYKLAFRASICVRWTDRRTRALCI